MIELKDFPTVEYIDENYPNVKLVIFDMDGTLVNTEGLHAEACKVVMDNYGEKTLSVAEFEDLYIGMGDDAVYEDLVKRGYLSPKSFGVDAFLKWKTDCFVSLLKNSNSEQIMNPAMEKIVNSLSVSTKKVALVTASEREAMEIVLDIIGMRERFVLTRSREDSKRTKPFPDPYLDVFKLLSLNPEDVLIFEDSETGYQAAVASGAKAVRARWYF